jgi:SAM-dependent methyltransferase
MSLNDGERQVAPTVDGIRRDHVARYKWAAAHLQGLRAEGGELLPHVLDVACGIGYGSRILADAGFRVTGKDRDAEAIEYGRQHYAHERVTFFCEDVRSVYAMERADAAVCFETVEHLEDPLPFLRMLRAAAPRLLVSVPNESAMPFRGPGHEDGYAFHHRHYTTVQFLDLLTAAGWRPVSWWEQMGPLSEVEPMSTGAGRTIIAVCERDAVAMETAEAPSAAGASAALMLAPEVPEHVVILGLGPSLECYVDVVKRLGARRRFADEVWGINAVGDVVHCDRIFHMDDVRVQEIRAKAKPQSNIAAMLEWMREHPGPIYTSRAHHDYPGLVEYPLQDVINSCGIAYFNSTAAYAVAYAVHIGVKKITVFGCDYTMANAHHAEKGRGCLEFHLGIAKARGIVIGLPDSTSLMDSAAPFEERVYGYDTVRLEMSEDSAGHVTVTATPRERIVTAEEIEERYRHDKHPNVLVAKGAG